MPDREKVIKDLEECLSASCRGFRPRVSCPYNDDEWDIMRDALELLKEQDAVEPKQGEWIYCEDASGQDGYKCSECGFFEPWYYDYENHNFITDYAYCPSCGKPMQEGR